jgi:hypothetical protein
MASEDAARFMARAKELRELAKMMSLRKDRACCWSPPKALRSWHGNSANSNQTN